MASLSGRRLVCLKNSEKRKRERAGAGAGAEFFWPYGERFGWREEERGSDAEEGSASGEWHVEDAGPPVHGPGAGGEVAGEWRGLEGGWEEVGWGGPVEREKTLLPMRFASTVFWTAGRAFFMGLSIHGPYSGFGTQRGAAGSASGARKPARACVRDRRTAR